MSDSFLFWLKAVVFNLSAVVNVLLLTSRKKSHELSKPETLFHATIAIVDIVLLFDIASSLDTYDSNYLLTILFGGGAYALFVTMMPLFVPLMLLPIELPVMLFVGFKKLFSFCRSNLFLRKLFRVLLFILLAAVVVFLIIIILDAFDITISERWYISAIVILIVLGLCAILIIGIYQFIVEAIDWVRDNPLIIFIVFGIVIVLFSIFILS